jgi:CHAT domain-containing protein
VGDRAGEATTLGNVAVLYRSQNKLPEALAQINAAIELIEQLRGALQDDNLKTAYFATVQGYYQFKIDLLMQLHRQQPQQGYDGQALATADQGRARVLRELLTEANAQITKDIDPQVRQREQDLHVRLAAQEKELARLVSTPEAQAQVAGVQAAIAGLYAEQERLKAEIRRTNPAYGELQYPQPLTLAQIQQQLDDHTLMLYYALGEERSYLWAVTKTSLTSYELADRATLEQAAQALLAVINDAGLKGLPGPVAVTTPSANAQGRTLTATAQTLSDLILKPVAPHLADHRLVIVADGALQTVPFAALNRPGQAAYTPLVSHHDVVHLPSASTISILRETVLRGRALAPKTLAVLADPVFTADDPRYRPAPSQAAQPSPAFATGPAQSPPSLDQGFLEDVTRSLSQGLRRLPATRAEADAILALVPNPGDRIVAFDFEANYDWVTNPQLAQYRYLLLATHGLIDQENPALSSLVLAQFDPQGQPVRRGFLRLGDLFNLELGAELVVLSACETALGKTIRGEGMIGLTRGLMYAGAPRVVTSLWNINDRATAEFMTQFYQAVLTEGQPPAAALSATQRGMWQQGQSPYLWAAFTLQGEWR